MISTSDLTGSQGAVNLNSYRSKPALFQVSRAMFQPGVPGDPSYRGLNCLRKGCRPLNEADVANTQAFTAALASGEYVQIRNALIVLNKLVKVGSVVLMSQGVA